MNDTKLGKPENEDVGGVGMFGFGGKLGVIMFPRSTFNIWLEGRYIAHSIRVIRQRYSAPTLSSNFRPSTTQLVRFQGFAITGGVSISFGR